MEPIVAPEVRWERAAWTWSASKWKTWKECNELYGFQYLMRVPLERPSERPFVQGSIAHEIMEKAHEELKKGAINASNLEEWALDNLDSVFQANTAKVTDWKGLPN